MPRAQHEHLALRAWSHRNRKRARDGFAAVVGRRIRGRGACGQGRQQQRSQQVQS
ncbi:hypothetical protein [Luteimonas salinilitoris]|uniref:Uncharacterized protein n=1 Tax=Luteimonas salinilitoris TaxID=3237697 RepID=A0ABV4HQ11_9GAMM